MATEHYLTTVRTNLGRSAVFGRPLYGTLGTCSCGWRWKINKAPSSGGTAAVRRQWKEHRDATLAGS